MYIEAVKQGENLILKYENKSTRSVTLPTKNGNYSYEEIRKAVMLEILAYGAPYHGAVLEHENGNAVDAGASLGKGTYRMKCYLLIANELEESYVYLTVE